MFRRGNERKKKKKEKEAGKKCEEKERSMRDRAETLATLLVLCFRRCLLDGSLSEIQKRKLN
jgi:hypothetical protein